MGRTWRHTRFVIFARSLRSDDPKQYVRPDRTITYIGSLAARFSNRNAALEFAQEKGIDLDQGYYLGTEGFTEFEVKAQGMTNARVAA